MTDYITKMINEFDYKDELKTKATTPATNYIFKVNNQCNKLSKEKSEIFHTYVAKGLFLCKRARPDIQLAIAFLCTRVKQPDEDDWKKLIRLLNYLNGTKNLYLTLEMDEAKIIKWYTDASFAIHQDYRSHTGATMTFGKGGIINISTKQKINTKSSTEAELVAVDNISGHLIWTNYFLQHQGYKFDITLFQDNKSTKLLLEYRKVSLIKRTGHIDIRYYFLLDRIKKREISVKHCLTEEMIADYFTKPLQGQKFKKFRKMILNIEEK